RRHPCPGAWHAAVPGRDGQREQRHGGPRRAGRRGGRPPAPESSDPPRGAATQGVRGARFDRVPLRYAVPNAVTATSMALALTAIVQASRGAHESAAWLVVACALMDRLDGLAARRMRACSEFGVHFDSLADLLAFCAVPALLVYFLLSD